MDSVAHDYNAASKAVISVQLDDDDDDDDDNDHDDDNDDHDDDDDDEDDDDDDDDEDDDDDHNYNKEKQPDSTTSMRRVHVLSRFFYPKHIPWDAAQMVYQQEIDPENSNKWDCIVL